MGAFELADLTAILRSCAGADDNSALDGDILDDTFADLGYDSIALLETAGRIQVEYGVALTDEAALAAPTPRDFLRVVNDSMASAGRSAK